MLAPSDATRIDVLGPFTWLQGADHAVPSIFDAAEAGRCGVYLVTVATSAGWLIFWVGQTSRPFRARFQTHTREYFAGTYNVLDVAELGAGRRTLRWKGMWWRKSSSARYEEYLTQAAEVLPFTRALLRAARIFLLPIPADRRLLARLEATIVNTLYAAPSVGEILDKGYHLAPRWKDEQPVSVYLDGPGFLGLPTLMEI